MKFPQKLIWDIIGDGFAEIFDGDSRRPIDLLWQSYSDLAGQCIRYVDNYRHARDIFRVRPFAEWGTFSAKPELVERTTQLDGVILGQRDGIWNALTEGSSVAPTAGYFRLLGNSVKYSGGVTQPLQSNSSITTLSSQYQTEEWDIEDNPSFLFNDDTTIDASERWDSIGSIPLVPQDDGLLFTAPSSSWAILEDTLHYSGNEDWSLLFRFKVTQWDATSFYRALAINSHGDVGAAYEFRLSDDGNGVSVESGLYAKTRYETLTFSGSAITRTWGSFSFDGFRAGMEIQVTGSDLNDGTVNIVSVTPTTITVQETFTDETSEDVSLTNNLESTSGSTDGWRDKLQAATESDPVFIEMNMEYSATTAEIFSEVWLDDEKVSQSNPYRVSPGRRKIIVDLFNQTKEVNIVLDFIGARKGKIWESDEDLDFSTDIGRSFGYIYEVPEPMVNSSRIQWEPYDLTSHPEVLTQTNDTIKLELDENYNSYIPQYARIESGDDYIIGELLSTENNPTATYTIVEKSSNQATLSGTVDLRPWFTPDFEWIDESRFATATPLPFENKFCFFPDTEASEFDLYARYGSLLQMPKRRDSLKYLNTLRGMEYGLRSPHTPVHTSRGIGILLGLPYSNKQGFIESIDRITDEFGGAISDNLLIGGETISVDPYWDNNDLLVDVGTYVEYLEPLTQSVRVYDWVSNPELIQKRVESPWEQWGVFVVQVPGTIGLSPESGEDLSRYLSRTKGVHKTHLVDFFDQRDENMFDDGWDDIEHVIPETFAHTLEDIIFDDAGEVVQNNPDYQTINGEKYTEEYQLDGLNSLDEGHKLDQFEALDSDRLVNFDAKYIDNGITLNKLWPDDPEYYLGNAGIYLKQPLTTAETDAGFQKNTLRVNKPNDTQSYFARPYSLAFVFDSTSPQFSVRDGGGTLEAYHTQTWENVTHGGLETHNAVFLEDMNFGYVAANNGTIYETTDYGENWTTGTMGSATTENFLGAHSRWVVGTNSIAYERQSGTWTSITVTGSSYTFVDVFFADSNTGWILAHDGVDTTIFKTTDGGTNWDAGTTVATGELGTGMYFIDENTGWVATNTNLHRTENGGSSWPVSVSGGYNEVTMITEDIVIAVADSGLISRSTNGTDASPSFSGSPGDVTNSNINAVDFIDSGVGVIVADNDEAYSSFDFGVTWGAISPGLATNWTDVSVTYPFGRIAIGGTDTVRWY